MEIGRLMRNHQLAGGLWQKLLLAVASPLVFLLALEGILALVGVRSVLHRRDPFVGFATGQPLFTPVEETGGRQMSTAPNKLDLFNPQRFARHKPAGAYRIFCLGGSTTYGRPYDDATSFAGWLRELLPAADGSRPWEVVNAGGISYASYRVAALMEELAGYEPDLFVVYTGHNEFLEERTYRAMRELPAALRWASGQAAKTRTWAAMAWLLGRAGPGAARGEDRRELLPENVETRLDHSAGPELYTRDDRLAGQVAEHYRVSLERMTAIARGAGARILFITPAANLKDSAPFKSEHGEGLGAADRDRVDRLLTAGRASLAARRWPEALESLDAALAIDDRHAEAHFRRGRALVAQGRAGEALAAFERARDEDICPLRATGPLLAALEDVVRRTGLLSIDFTARLEEEQRAAVGHSILGREQFLDHVHPTPEAHRTLALMVIDALEELGVAHAGPSWGPAAVAEVTARVEAGLDPRARARALANLAWTLDWAGKDEESRRLALRALESGFEDVAILLIAARHAAFEGDRDGALELARRAVRAEPRSAVAHYQTAMLQVGRRDLEAAAGHLLMARFLAPGDDKVHRQLGLVLAERRRFDIALPSLLEARRLNSRVPGIDRQIAQVRAALEASGGTMRVTRVEAATYPSGAVREVVMSSAAGPAGPHGLRVAWHETGDLDRLVDYVDGRAAGGGRAWDAEGNALPPVPAAAR